MIITLLEVGELANKSKGKSKWREFTIKYQNSSGVESSRTFRDFSDKEVFETAQKLQPGRYDVKAVKDGDFWKWVSIEPAKSVPENGNKVPNDNRWENFEERAKRQQLIVRQSSITNALEYANYYSGFSNPDNPSLTLDEILAVAQRFYDWVFQNSDSEQENQDD